MLVRSSSRLPPQAVITFDACSSSTSAISRCSSVAYSCRRRLASPSALWRVCSSSRAKLGIDAVTPGSPGMGRTWLTMSYGGAFQSRAGALFFRGLPLEQLFGGGAVGRDALDVGFDAGDLGLERRDALVQLLDRDRVEILLAEL